MTGIILIVIGLLISGAGILILSKSSKAQLAIAHQSVETIPIDSVNARPATESDIYSKAGLDFEKYVVLKFNKKYYSIKAGRGINM